MAYLPIPQNFGNDAKGCFETTFCVISKSQFTAILRVLCQNRIDLVIRNEL